jgi:hypothetical protein
MDEKTCTKCLETKPISEFSKKGKGNNNFRAMNVDNWSSLKPTCKACDAAYAREFRKKNPGYQGSGKNSKYPKEERMLISAIRARLNVCMNNQRKRGKQFETDVTDDYLYDLFQKQNGLCKYSGIPLKIQTKHLATLSLDKIVPEKGYMKGNVQWVCWAVNRAKGELDEKEFIQMCRMIAERCND